MTLGGFEVRKWSSNNSFLLRNLPPSHVSTTPLPFNDASSDLSVKVLGLQWNPDSDFLFSQFTRYLIASAPNACYFPNSLDPLGFLSPVTFYTKYLIQRLWLSGIGWDETPPSDIARAWSQYKSELPLLSDIRIARCILFSESSDYELHGFCDASERGYASVVYLRVFHPDNSISVHFLCGKSNVAPLKTISIPRLLDLPNIYAWSDSQIVLNWIRNPPHRVKTFVANRISYIQNKLPLASWSYINTSNNPADVALRGILPRSLTCCDLRFHGPSFLCEPTITPPETPTLDDSALLSIGNKEKKLVLLNYPPAENFLDSLLNGKSSYVLRFLHNVRSPNARHFGSLTNAELYNATLALVKFTQHLHFSDELNSQRFSRPLSFKLSVFLDSNSILRVRGRLKHANLNYETKYPILSPCHSRFTSLIINHFHQKYFHTGPRATQYLLSQQFWILSFKRAINSCLTKCIQCYKSNPKCFQPSMGNLPAARVTELKPFSHSAVDFRDQILSYEEFYTVLTLIESVLNSRPLTPMTSDVNDFTALTPGHFLTLDPVSSLSVPDFSGTPINRLSRWQLLQRLHRDFWRRWHLEYLNTLQQRKKSLKPENPPKIGTLVLIRDNNILPAHWKLGRIAVLHPGDDAIARVATVKTASGVLKRPLNALSPLPIE
ncbi:hypothetical protein NQ317_016998 [Molorchus minor]|uniref:DUF5641 domain-containing protein n=1 Tax=Molorchus minor TaxID=1323400 RepID=A0ABQ9JM34_9CUCU|nr:hypothetical protein NQ317_016998 [Molorchus minor]